MNCYCFAVCGQTAFRHGRCRDMVPSPTVFEAAGSGAGVEATKRRIAGTHSLYSHDPRNRSCYRLNPSKYPPHEQWPADTAHHVSCLMLSPDMATRSLSSPQSIPCLSRKSLLIRHATFRCSIFWIWTLVGRTNSRKSFDTPRHWRSLRI